MILSKASEYSIRATVFIALKSLEGEKVNLKEISIQIESPEAFTSKLLQLLKKSGIVRSSLGKSGGFDIEKEKLESLNLCHIVNAVDGKADYSVCIMGLKACSDNVPCPMHSQYRNIKQNLNDLLHNTKLLTLAKKLRTGQVFLTN